MAGGHRTILIDARVNALPGAHGLARSVMKLVGHMGEPDDGLTLRVLVNPRHEQIFPLSELPAYADLIGTDVTVFAQHRCWELARLIRALDAAVLYVPYPTFTPLVRQFGPVTATAVATARARYQLPERFILAVGAHRPHKNHEVLVRALAAVPGDVGLVIVGYFDPNFGDPLPGLIAELGLESRVKLVPEVAEEWLPAVYRAASVFAFPSLAEGYGIPVLEAMAAGVPVVMSDIEVLAEVAGSAAVMVPPRDVAGWASAVTAVLSDAALSGRLTGAGSAVAAAAGWEHGASALGRLLSAVAAGRLTRTCVTSPVSSSTRPRPAAGHSSVA
jgi:glycosyltransferase involved in cell wall biosynthesis